MPNQVILAIIMSFSLKLQFFLKRLLPGLDVLALLTWAILLFKYWVTGQLKLLIHLITFGWFLSPALFSLR